MAGKFLDIKAMMRAVDTRDKNWFQKRPTLILTNTCGLFQKIIKDFYGN